MNPTKFLMFYKAGNDLAQRAVDDLLLHYPDAVVIAANRGEPFPAATVRKLAPDYIISYICPWIIPSWCLDLATTAAINFHPGPPEYPGTGCTNFAIYDQATDFGVTCHHMLPGVDSGRIIAVERFPLLTNDSVMSLTLRCYEAIYQMFKQILAIIAQGQPLPESHLQWKKKPYTRKMLNELCRLTIDMPRHEVKRRIRATSFPGAPGAYLDWHDEHFIWQEQTEHA